MHVRTLFMQEIAYPLLRRVGTAVSAFLVANGVSSDQLHQAVLGILAILGILADLWQDRRARRKERDAARSVGE